MTLRPQDEGALKDLGRPWSSQISGRLLHLTIESYPLPPGLSRGEADLLLRLPAGFPDAAPDMFWLAPDVLRADGTVPAGTQARMEYDGRTWQRWSRHIRGAWRPAQDGLATYLAYVRRCLALETRPKQEAA